MAGYEALLRCYTEAPLVLPVGEKWVEGVLRSDQYPGSRHRFWTSFGAGP